MWTDLGAAEPQPVRADAKPVASAPVMRLRRHQRPVLGALDAAAATLQQNAREVLLGPALLLVPVAVLNVVVSNLVYDDFSSFDETAVSLPEFVGGVDSATGAETLLAFVAILTGSLAVALAGGYLTVLVLRRANGLPVTIGACLRGTLLRLPALLVAWVIGHSWMVLASLALVRLSGGDLAPFIVVVAPAILFMVALTALVSPAIVAERMGSWRGLRRGFRLARARFGTVLTFLLFSVLLGGGLRVAITWMPQLVEQSGIVSFGGSTWLVEGIAGQLAPLVVIPWIALATAVLYLQIRMDAEGLDLVVESDRVFGVIARFVVRVLGPDDPLGPVDQDADEIRQDACRLVAPDGVCSPREPSTPDTPSGGGGAWAAVFEMVVWVVFFALIAALVFVIVRVLMTTKFGSRRRRRKDTSDDAGDVEELSPVVVDRTREPADWRREAEEHRAAGRHRDAVRCRYRALVGDLARRGLIDEIPGRTSGEERTQMTAVAPREAPAFSSAAELFDGAWFGDVPVADEDVQRMEALEVRVLAGAGTPAS